MLLYSPQPGFQHAPWVFYTFPGSGAFQGTASVTSLLTGPVTPEGRWFLCRSLLVSQWCTRATRWPNSPLHSAVTLEGAHRFGRRALPQIHLCRRTPCPRLPFVVLDGSVTGSGAIFWSELEQQPQ